MFVNVLNFDLILFSWILELFFFWETRVEARGRSRALRLSAWRLAVDRRDLFSSLFKNNLVAKLFSMLAITPLF